MIARILCLLFGHKPDLDNSGWTLMDDSRRNAFTIEGCERCGCVYIARHTKVNQRR